MAAVLGCWPARPLVVGGKQAKRTLPGGRDASVVDWVVPPASPYTTGVLGGTGKTGGSSSWGVPVPGVIRETFVDIEGDDDPPGGGGVPDIVVSGAQQPGLSRMGVTTRKTQGEASRLRVGIPTRAGRL